VDTSAPPLPAAAAVPTRSGGEDQAIDSLADRLERKARELEPSTTERLEKLAAAAGGAMVGLEHRFKTRSSIVRKIRQRLSTDPERKVVAVVINDALRYTMRVEDRPVGNYDRTVRSVLSELESAGHRITEVKNYWPRGDNYSGVNSVLLADNGLEWELQFHTRASLQAQKEGRPYYEEMRRVDTPPARKRVLFDKLAAPWEEIPIPKGVLEPRSLHANERIILRGPPR
ncbi:MAG: hypothetical protein KJO07_20145, partial [Deltaproteobacteria bacterium]|nr:hypothetical protein [Deltaproteobacteria bacterium]